MTRVPNTELPFLPIENSEIPIPAFSMPKKTRVPHARWGLERLEVGQSVFMKGAKAHPKKLLFLLKKNHGLLFTSRIYWDKNGNLLGVRVWRVV